MPNCPKPQPSAKSEAREHRQFAISIPKQKFNSIQLWVVETKDIVSFPAPQWTHVIERAALDLANDYVKACSSSAERTRLVDKRNQLQARVLELTKELEDNEWKAEAVLQAKLEKAEREYQELYEITHEQMNEDGAKLAKAWEEIKAWQREIARAVPNKFYQAMWDRVKQTLEETK